MCVIIAKPAGVKRLDTKYFERAWTRNPDGGGLVWKKPGEEVFIQKGFMNKDEMLAKIDELNQDDTAFIAHFRIKSVGAVCPENTHPFAMDHVTYAHNGTLSIKPFEGKTDSETFGLAFLKDKHMAWIKKYQVLLEMALDRSKFAIMDNVSGEIFILNKDLGQERDGAWFSNDSAFPPAAPAYNPYKGYNWGGYDDDYDSDSLPLPNSSTFRAQKNWGTKRWTKTGTKVSSNSILVWSDNDCPIVIPGYPKCAMHKRGFAIINPAIPVPEEAQDKEYPKGAPERILVEQMTRLFYKTVTEYQKGTYKTIKYREEAEQELSAVYTVIKVMNKFINAGKAIDDNEFYSFCLDNTESDTWVTRYHSEFNYGEFVELYAEQVLKELKKLSANNG